MYEEVLQKISKCEYCDLSGKMFGGGGVVNFVCVIELFLHFFICGEGLIG